MGDQKPNCSKSSEYSRRQALRQLSSFAAYVAPAMVVLIPGEALAKKNKCKPEKPKPKHCSFL